MLLPMEEKVHLYSRRSLSLDPATENSPNGSASSEAHLIQKDYANIYWTATRTHYGTYASTITYGVLVDGSSW